MNNYLVISYESGDDDHIGEIFTVTAKDKEHARAKARQLYPHACHFSVSLAEEDAL